MAADYRGSDMLGKMTTRLERRPSGRALWLAASFSCAVFGFGAGRLATARELEPRVLSLVSSGQTVTGETLVYPAGAPAKVTAVVLTLQPGEETGFHTHGVPVFGYMLEGDLTVDYADKSVRVFKSGEALLEAMTVAHNGSNTGQGPMRILAVYMGAEGVVLTTPMKN